MSPSSWLWFGTIFPWTPLAAVILLFSFLSVVDVMIVPNVLSEVIPAFEPIRSSILPAVFAWKTLSILSVSALMYVSSRLNTLSQLSCLHTKKA